jgi:hypothetical protein
MEFFPTTCSVPTVTATEAAIFAATDLIKALQNPAPNSPFSTLGIAQATALRQLADIFNTNVQPQKHKPSPFQAGRQHIPTTSIEHSPLRVPKEPLSPPRVTETPAASPRVSPATNTTHCYPTRSRDHIANFLGTIELPNPELWIPDKLKQPVGNDTIWMPHMANAVIDSATGESLKYRQLIKRDDYRITWTRSFANELGRLAQGVGDRIVGTNTIVFIPQSAVPVGRTVTYGRIVVDIRPQKDEPERTRLTVGGNLIDYPGDVSTKTAGLTTANILFNSVVSTKDARFMCLDVKNIYLNTPMDRYEYMCMHIDLLPDEIILQYNLRALANADG